MADKQASSPSNVRCYSRARLNDPRINCGLLFAVAASESACAFFLPNTFGDAYVYILDIGTLSTKIKAGTFALTDLYGFWLPR